MKSLFCAPTRAARTDERGAILILTALVMILMLMIAAFATDLGAWYRQGQQQQRAADVGSLNGIKAYDARVKAYITAQGASSYAALSATQKNDVEQLAMQDAVDAIVDALAATGTTISGSTVITPGCCVPPPGVSTVTLTADDGTQIVIVRDEQAGQSRITVTLTRPGAQYFTSVVRDAPDIARSGTSVISNCGATCNIPIVINPPFQGFNAAGSGDGFAPLLRDDDEIWTVNHHVRTSSEGEIVCMDRDTEALCTPQGLFSLGDYKTANRPVEYVDDATDRIYFTVRNAGNNRSGLACFDMVARDWCSPRRFRRLWDQSSHGWPQIVNATGPWHYNNKLYVMGQHGQLKCVNKNADMTTCGTWNTAAYGHAAIPGIGSGSPRIINGEQDGSKIYFTHILPSGVVFHCWDVASNAACASWPTARYNTSVGGDEDQQLTHFRYDALSHNPIGICVTDLESDTNACYDFSGGGPTSVAGLSVAVAILDNTWAGDTFTWEGRRTFFAGGNSNRTGCWNWETGSSCGTITHPSATNPYAYAQVTPNCIVGLGHGSKFFSFNPDGLFVCTDANVETTINPCKCGDGSNKWGVVQIPVELLAKVNELKATVTQPDGTVVLNQFDLVASNGYFDLGGADPAAPYLNLVLEVDSKLKADGTPEWTDPINADLTLIVQPTLAN